MRKIRFHLAKDMVSSTGKFHFGLPKKQKIGLSHTDFVIYLYIKWLQKYNPHWNPHWNLHWNPHWNPHWKILLWGSGRLTLGFTKSRWWWHEWNELHVWFDDYLWDSTTKIQQKNAISKFSRISATNPPTKWCDLGIEGHCGASEQEATPPCWRDSNNDSCQLCSSWKNLREHCVFCS